MYRHVHVYDDDQAVDLETTDPTSEAFQGELERLKAIVAAGYADCATEEEKKARYKVWDRFVFMKRMARRPKHLVPGVYKLKAPVLNVLGDARSNNTHWRGKLQKKIDLPVGFVFEVALDGTIIESNDPGTRIHPWNHDGSDDDTPKEAARKAKARQFLRDLMDNAEPATVSPVRQIDKALGWVPSLETFLDQLVKDGVDVVDLARRAVATEEEEDAM